MAKKKTTKVSKEKPAKSLREALSAFPNKVVHMSDLILNEISYGDYSSLSFLKASFRDLPSEVALTASAYLRYGLDASLASDALYIHRNTFLYRLEKFKSLTGMDIRDYHDALLYEIYSGLLKK